MKKVATWTFEVYAEDLYDGNVTTDWYVEDVRDGEEFPDIHSGTTAGPLHEALFDAYDALGITCPVVTDPDLLWMGGHD